MSAEIRIFPPVFLLVFPGPHQDRGGVGNLLAAAMDDGFADQFGNQEPLRLVGEFVFGEEGGPFLELVEHRLQQDLDALAGPGRDGHHRLEVEPVSEPGHQRQQLGLRDLVDFVEGQDYGLAGLTQQVGDGAVVGAVALRGVDHPDHHVGLADSRMGDAHHSRMHGVKRLDESGGIDERDLAVRSVDVAEDPVARGLRLVRRDRDLLAHQPVQQGGLARRGPSHDRDEARLEPGRRLRWRLGRFGPGDRRVAHDSTSMGEGTNCTRPTRFGVASRISMA